MKISLSILDFDFSNLTNELEPLYPYIDYLHMDVMDGNFVPNLSFGVPIIKSLRKQTKVLFDTHLMITNPKDFINDFSNAGSDLITFHYESNSDVLQTIKAIKAKNKQVGLSIKPNTSLDVIKPYLSYLDLVLIMSVEPGFGGQKFMTSVIDKLRSLKELQKEYDFKIFVDGGINLDTISEVKDLCDTVIVGSCIAKSTDRINTLLDLKR